VYLCDFVCVCVCVCVCDLILSMRVCEYIERVIVLCVRLRLDAGVFVPAIYVSVCLCVCDSRFMFVYEYIERDIQCTGEKKVTAVCVYIYVCVCVTIYHYRAYHIEQAE
jgi:hypothetical protein